MQHPNMKRSASVLASLLAPALAGQAAVLDFDGINALIPDGRGTGLADVRTVTSAQFSGVISGISVGLNISGGGTGGGYNGDLYATLRHESGAFVVLLNRPGRTATDLWGYPDSGLQITFEQTGGDVHLYRSVLGGPPGGSLSGSWGPDGRAVDPGVVTDNPALRTTSFDSFLGINPTGKWTLFVADLERGGLSRLDSWSLNISTVPIPEPATGLLAAGLGLAGFAWYRRQRRT